MPAAGLRPDLAFSLLPSATTVVIAAAGRSRGTPSAFLRFEVRATHASVGIEEPPSPRRRPSAQLWDAVDDLIDRAPSLGELREHRLQLLAARRWLETGRTLPQSLKTEQTLAAAFSLPVRSLLARVGAAWAGPFVVLKGPELASRYLDGALRPARDLDLLVDDAPGAHAALREAGFLAVGDPRRYVGIHHLQPLMWPNLPVTIELHHAPKWIAGLEPPPTAEMLELTVPARGDAEGFLTLSPAAHAVVLAVHSWAHEPLHSLRDLIDIALVAEEADPDEMNRLARRWRVPGVWETTQAVVQALFSEGRRPLALRVWARHLEAARGRTVVESHLERWLSCYWALPAPLALRRTLARIGDDLRPVPGETWGTKLARARLAARNAGARRTAHQRLLEEARLATPPPLLLDRLERRRVRRAGTGEGAARASSQDGSS